MSEKKYSVYDKHMNLIGYTYDLAPELRVAENSDEFYFQMSNLESSQQRTGNWHNLTTAIAAGELIDWERLERRKIKITHPEEVEIFGYLKSDLDLRLAGKLHLSSAWTLGNSLNGWTNRFLREALSGSYGWELYIMGEIPMRNQTADQLPIGMCFKGVEVINGEKFLFDHAQIIQREGDKSPVMVNYDQNLKTTQLHFDLVMVEVLEEYGIGTFKKESE